MRYFVIRLQLVFVSLILFATLTLVTGIVIRNNYRWDATSEKIYSISDTTLKLLKALEDSPIEVLAFYPHDDPARSNFEVFLKECQLHHRGFHYSFFDPDRVPSLAKQYGVKNYYTVVLKYQGRQENIVAPSEENFTNALLRLSNPKKFNLCFVTGHDEAPMKGEDRNSISSMRATFETMNYGIHEIILLRDRVPEQCNVVIVAGPHQDFDQKEFNYLKKSFRSGRGLLFMIDPMDPGAGKAFREFMKSFSVLLGEDVVVDKMSRLVGGDFLVPLVNQYVTVHPITANFQKPTFFPVSRSVQPSDESKSDYEVVPLALSSNGSWAESNLQALEKGDSTFDPASGDLQGPIPIAVAVERQPAAQASGVKNLQTEKLPPNRMVVVGDSDFFSNAYVHLGGNTDFAINIIQWLTRDDRFISIHPREPKFQPLFLNTGQRTLLLFICVAALPLLGFLLGAGKLYLRKRSL